jgi:hypothetical protein
VEADIPYLVDRQPAEIGVLHGFRVEKQQATETFRKPPCRARKYDGKRIVVKKRHRLDATTYVVELTTKTWGIELFYCVFVPSALLKSPRYGLAPDPTATIG